MTNLARKFNRVRDRRVARGLTQAELADRAGISRSAVAAIEGKRLVPSVAAAMSLAAALECTVEELFDPSTQRERPPDWAWEPTTTTNTTARSSHFWEAEVADRILKYPAFTSPMLTSLPDVSAVNSLSSRVAARETLVLACCDPAAGLLASHFQAVTGMRLIVIPRSGGQAAELLRNGLVHLAGLHLATADDPAGNSKFVRTCLGSEYELIRLSKWQEGVVLARGSGHRSVRSVVRGMLTWIGREEGSGARQCLDRILSGRRTPRYVAPNHLGVAMAVQSGCADAGVCVQVVAEEAGLRFLPVQEEAYDVCYARALVGDRRLTAFIKVVRSIAYRRLLGDLPGFDTSETGCVSDAE